MLSSAAGAAMPVAYPRTPETELFHCAQSGDVHGVRALLRAGAVASCSIDASTGCSALAVSLLGGHTQAAEALVDAGADPCHTDQRGNTAMHACAAGAAAANGDDAGCANGSPPLLNALHSAPPELTTRVCGLSYAAFRWHARFLKLAASAQLLQPIMTV